MTRVDRSGRPHEIPVLHQKYLATLHQWLNEDQIGIFLEVFPGPMPSCGKVVCDVSKELGHGEHSR